MGFARKYEEHCFRKLALREGSSLVKGFIHMKTWSLFFFFSPSRVVLKRETVSSHESSLLSWVSLSLMGFSFVHSLLLLLKVVFDKGVYSHENTELFLFF